MILLNELGKDATEAFEDTGHTKEARELLAKMYVGDFEGESVRTTCLTTLKLDLHDQTTPDTAREKLKSEGRT